MRLWVQFFEAFGFKTTKKMTLLENNAEVCNCCTFCEEMCTPQIPLSNWVKNRSPFRHEKKPEVHTYSDMADAAFDAWIVIEVGLRREEGLLRGIDSENDLARVLREVVWPTLNDEFKENIQEHQETYSKAKEAHGAARETCANFKRFLDKKAGGTANYDFSVEDEGDRYDKDGKRKVTLQGYVEQWQRLIGARRAFKVAIADLRDLLERCVEDIIPPDERIVGNMTWSQKQLDDMYEEETKLKDADEHELKHVLLRRIKFGEQRAAERLESRRQDLGVGKQWIGGWGLGGGGFGSATIWVKQDSQGRIVDVSLPTAHSASFFSFVL